MYCKSCGAENHPSASYCVNDGTLLTNTNVKFRMKDHKVSFCSSCGSKTEGSYNYCIECGYNTSQYITLKSSEGKQSLPKEFGSVAKGGAVKLPAINIEFFKKMLLPGLLAILVVFLLSFSVMKQSEKLYDSLVSNSLSEFDVNSMIEEIEGYTDSDLPDLNKIYGFSDIVMMSNLQNPVITLNGNIFGKVTAEVEAKNGFIIYLLIPFLGLFGAGIYAGRKNKNSGINSHLSNALGIGVIYAVVMSIFSLFAGFSYDINISKVSLSMDNDYSFFKTLFMTLLFGFFFSFIGSLFSINFRKATGHLAEWLPSGEAIHQAIVIPFRAIFIFTVGLFIYLSSKLADFKEGLGDWLNGTPLEQLLDKSYALIASLSVQLGSFFWNLLHFSPLTLLVNEEGEKGSLAYGVFSGLIATGEAKDDSDILAFDSLISSADFDLYLKIALIIPIALFLWAGFKIAKRDQMVKNLIVFSVVYSIIMMILAAFTDIGFVVSSHAMGESTNMEMNLGFGAAGTFMKSLLFSFVFAYLGTWIHKFTEKG
ncbi:hypothetical protein [Neobacillus sp. LXY-1]|uniref:hypothetical protein n=1 Tax=Neobacillus sp. LXY-1 TaxID=3379133 RepID=UPI003EE0482B